MKEIKIRVAELADLKQGVINTLNSVGEAGISMKVKLTGGDDPYSDIIVRVWDATNEQPDAAAILVINRKHNMVRGRLEDLRRVASLNDSAFDGLDTEGHDRLQYASFYVEVELIDKLLTTAGMIWRAKEPIRLD